MIKTFFGTTVFRLVIVLAGWIYMNNMQPDALYRFFDMTNPATAAVSACYSGFTAAEDSITNKLDIILSTLQEDQTTTSTIIENTTGAVTVITGSNLTGDLNDIVFTTN